MLPPKRAREAGPHRHASGLRALSRTTGIAILAAFVVLAGLATFWVYQVTLSPSSSSGTTIISHCSPPTSPKCILLAPGHDATLVVPFASAETQTTVPARAVLPSFEAATTYTFNFGDGAAIATPSPSLDHTYAGPGDYILSVTAMVNGYPHDNDFNLTPLSVGPSFYARSLPGTPSISATVVSNSTSHVRPTAVVQGSETVTLLGSYTSTTASPGFQLLPPTMAVPPSGFVANSSSNATQAEVAVGFTTPGVYPVMFVGAERNISTGGIVYQNFTWTVFVAAQNVHASLRAGATATDTHPGALVGYELAGGGARSEDPAIDYESTGMEPIANVYQTLITYNGSRVGPQPEDFVPELATCVPGSEQCAQLYGSTLVSGSDYTFVIQGNASFFDPNTGAHWGVWPTDVVFSIARTLAFSTLPYPERNNGWILAQALLEPGNSMWDSIHGVYNTTPQEILGSMSINESGLCTSAMLAPPNHGCVTFHADAGGQVWPYFLELIAFPLGASVVPCGWFSASYQGAGIPFWTRGNVSGTGDHPCGAPGTAGYGLAPTDPALPAKGWDQWEEAASGSASGFLGSVQWTMAGSGPYYLSQLFIGSGYSLKANPDYTRNPFCTWQGCPPAAGSFASSVEVTWELQTTEGESALLSGAADFATVPSSDSGNILSWVENGTVSGLTFPTLTIGLDAFNLKYNASANLNPGSADQPIPSDALTYVGLRQFLANAYPYSSVNSTLGFVDGIQWSTPLKGGIPPLPGGAAPTNVSWPSGNPASQVGGAAWWWTQMTTSSLGPYFDPELAGCTVLNPCDIPWGDVWGGAYGGSDLTLWASEVSQLSGGTLKLVTGPSPYYPGPNAGNPPPDSPWASLGVGWAPDYPDPTDYATVLYSTDGLFPQIDSVGAVLSGPSFNAPTCHIPTDLGWWSNESTHVGIATDCQGAAFSALQLLLSAAANSPLGTHRTLLYSMADHIVNALALYVYVDQANAVVLTQPYIDLSALNSNPMVGGSGCQLWFAVNGAAGAG